MKRSPLSWSNLGQFVAYFNPIFSRFAPILAKETPEFFDKIKAGECGALGLDVPACMSGESCLAILLESFCMGFCLIQENIIWSFSPASLRGKDRIRKSRGVSIDQICSESVLPQNGTIKTTWFTIGPIRITPNYRWGRNRYILNSGELLKCM